MQKATHPKASTDQANKRSSVINSSENPQQQQLHYNLALIHHTIKSTMINRVAILAALVASATAFSPAIRPVSVSTSLSAEWKPSDGKWEEKDFEGDLAKLEKEVEERLDAKISELMSKVETTGGK